MPAPAVSICLPVYNGENFLTEAIDSALSQTTEDFELLISDDRSQDSSWEIVQAYTKRDERIVAWSNPENLGLFANYNACLRQARGKYIKPLAQDDLLLPAALERMTQELDTNPGVVLVSCAGEIIDSDGRFLSVRKPFPDDRAIPGKKAIMDNLWDFGNWIGEPCAVMFRREVAGSGFSTEYPHYGDIEYWFRMLTQGDYKYISTALCKFRTHPQSATNDNCRNLHILSDIIRLAHGYTDFAESEGIARTEFFERAIEQMSTHWHSASTVLKIDCEGIWQQTPDSPLREFQEIAVRSLQYGLKHDQESRWLNDENQRLRATIEELRSELRNLTKSLSFRVMQPLRLLRKLIGTH